MSSAATFESSEAPAIEFQSVRIGFDEGDVLRNVSFRVMPRETLILLGETGTGKTLSLKLAAGLLKANSGSVRVLGKELGSMSERDLLHFRREVGFVFQEGALFDSMTVADNVGYRLHEDRAEPEEIEPRVREALRFVELERTMDLVPSELSGGMRRRVRRGNASPRRRIFFQRHFLDLARLDLRPRRNENWRGRSHPEGGAWREAR